MKIYAATPISGLTEDERRLMSLRAWDWIENRYTKPYSYVDFSVYMPIDYYDEDEKPGQTFRRNMYNLKASDVVVAFNPGGSRGCHFELGYATGRDEMAGFIVDFRCFPISADDIMLQGVQRIDGDRGPERFDHLDECVLRGTVAIPSDRCGCLDAGVELC